MPVCHRARPGRQQSNGRPGWRRPTRVEALRALEQIEDPGLDDLVARTIDDRDAGLRTESLRLLATLRGVRDYCTAYHRGANREEVTRILAKYSDVKDPALIDRIEWGATDVDGRIFAASVADIQDTFVKEKLVSDRVPLEKIAPVGWLAEVAASLGPFRLAHDDGTSGCR